MKLLAESRAKQLRDVSGFRDAGVYDPEGVGGTHVIYVLHDAAHPELYAGLPKNPRVSFAYQAGKSIINPLGQNGATLGFVGVVFHYVFEGPKREQPEVPPRKPEAPVGRKEA